MRAATRTRRATCALALLLSTTTPAAADRQRSVAACTAFEQADQGEDKVQFTIRNTCTIPIDCTVSWRLVCAPDSKRRRAAHPATLKLALNSNTTETALAAATVCGDDSWRLDNIQWSCQPNRD